MRKSIILCGLLACASLSNGQTAEPQFEGALRAESYSGGYVLSWDAPVYRHITVYGPDTKAVYSQSLDTGEKLHFHVWAVDSDGVMARAYTVRSDRGEGRIDLLDPSGKTIRTISTGPYSTQHLAFAPDHSLWAVGYDLLYAGEYPAELRPDDFNVLHHYDRTGEEISEGLPWSKIAGGHNAQTALQLCLGGKFLFATSDRIGFLSFLDYGHNAWIEASPDGNLLGKYPTTTDQVIGYQPVAMTASGRVYARIYEERRFKGWAILDRSKESWQEITTGYPKGTIIGSDGDNVIFSDHEGGGTVLHSVSSFLTRY